MSDVILIMTGVFMLWNAADQGAAHGHIIGVVWVVVGFIAILAGVALQGKPKP